MKEIQGGDYESCKNMIYKLALDRYHKISKKRPDLEFDDLLGEAMCIYSQCLTTFNNNKGMKFSTYLYMNLFQRLIDYTMFTMREVKSYEDFNYVGKDGSVKSYEESIVSPNYEIDNDELFKIAKDELSYEAYIVFKYIARREWEVGRIRAFPTKSKLAKHFGYSIDIINSVMEEIKLFWNKIGWQVA